MLETARADELVLNVFAEGLTPRAPRSVSEWADAERIVAPESGSPRPGKYLLTTAPYLNEIMDCLSPGDPCSDVCAKMSAQVGKSTVGENFIGHAMTDDPSPLLIVLPTLDEATKYNLVKLDPMLTGTPALRDVVKDVKSRAKNSSTVSRKRFPGGFAVLTGANSSSGLQMVSIKKLICEEVSEYPRDVGGRGDPLRLAIKRTDAWSRRGVKRFFPSTPGERGTCRVSTMYEASDQRRYYVPCPSCGAFQCLLFSALKYESTVPPFGAHMVCQESGCVIPHYAKEDMLAAGVWLKTYPGEDAPPPIVMADEVAAFRARSSGGRQPGFALWSAYSPFKGWDDIVREFIESRGKPSEEKTFCQQTLGEPWEEKGDSPDWAKLYEAREDFTLGVIPDGALVLTGACDVQRSPPRLEWAVWGWGVGLTSWLVDFGIILGSPEADETWRELERIIENKYPDRYGTERSCEAFAIDSGYSSHNVYKFTRHRPHVLATDGREGRTHPLLGSPRKVEYRRGSMLLKAREVAGAVLWPIGSHPLKTLLYAGLRKFLAGRGEDGAFALGTVHLNQACDKEFCQQITAENLVLVKHRSGTATHEWRPKEGEPNEQLDLWVMARAMAFHLRLDSYRVEQWRKLISSRAPQSEEAAQAVKKVWTPEKAAAATGRSAEIAARASKLAALNRRS